MLHKLIKSVLFPLSIMPLIGSCSIFEPKTKVIEYDEEVKLSDGSMIWVHIKRHYERSSGREISNWFQGYEKGWGAKEVEISWDTGFPNVGRKSLEFTQNVSFIDKVDNSWYIIGFTPHCKSPCIKDEYIRLNAVGSMAVIDNQGKLDKGASLNDLPSSAYHNILSPEAVKNWESLSKDLVNNKLLTWSKKVSIQNQQSNPSAVMGKAIYRGNKK